MSIEQFDSIGAKIDHFQAKTNMAFVQTFWYFRQLIVGKQYFRHGKTFIK
jgi:hypothetical protein